MLCLKWFVVGWELMVMECGGGVAIRLANEELAGQEPAPAGPGILRHQPTDLGPEVYSGSEVLRAWCS